MISSIVGGMFSARRSSSSTSRRARSNQLLCRRRHRMRRTKRAEHLLLLVRRELPLVRQPFDEDEVRIKLADTVHLQEGLPALHGQVVKTGTARRRARQDAARCERQDKTSVGAQNVVGIN